jgi:hypothetical protein
VVERRFSTFKNNNGYANGYDNKGGKVDGWDFLLDWEGVGEGDFLGLFSFKCSICANFHKN